MIESNILLTGGGGQIGTEFQRLAPKAWRIAAPDLHDLDIGNPAAVAARVGSQAWSAVINAAAFTAVDKAESEIAAAWRVNAYGPALLAEATSRANVPLIQLSTDYVFDGRKPGPYVEGDPVGPLSVYGASKEAGEQAVRTGNPRHIIVRTAWIISPHGANFAKTMLRLAAHGSALRVVDDQIGCPTSAADVADTLISIAKRLISDLDTPTGDYHFVNAGETSWCGLARAIFARMAERGVDVPTVEAIGTVDYPTPARRPANSRLDTAKLRRDFAITPRPWLTAADEVTDSLLDQSAQAGF